ncbi:MAG: hypothetical protein KGH60_01045 [Candidatus Micrarchaeota archaeon]|nr:hypothetical protein [Candidatus Micrarchaeota archaeon]
MDGDTPAWMLCEDILNKAKVELITEAMDTLNQEVKEGNIAVHGNIIELPDKPSETERDLFIINNMLQEADKMRDSFSKFINEKESDPKSLNAETVERIEKLKKFLLSLDKIELLMGYSTEFDHWIGDVAMQVAIDDPSRIISKTIEHNDLRREILAFILKSKTFEKEEIFNKQEREILEKGTDF